MSKYSKHRIAILGGGVAGVSLALFIKNRDPSFEVSIFDSSKKWLLEFLYLETDDQTSSIQTISTHRAWKTQSFTKQKVSWKDR